ncbi:MAG: zinc-ribbon domain-containing protein [Pseudomonadota bacterium]|nr:MAG: zinc-ribbon domain-containing protein [Pseudomonadota bacterium]
MYTKCPECSTVFRISDTQLMAASGKVRCGHCKHVFNALDRLLMDLPTGEPPPGSDEHFLTSTTEREAGEIDIDNIELAMPDEEPPLENLPQDSAVAEALTSGAWEFEVETESPVAEDAWADAEDEFEMPAPEPQAAPHPAATQPEATPATETVSDEDSARIVVPPPLAVQAPPQAPAFDTSSHANTHDDIPPQLRESLLAAQATASDWRRVAIASTSALLLLALLAGQLLVFSGTQLAARMPALSTWVASACQVLPCRYTGRRDLDNLQLTNRDIRTDPAEKGVLVITATIVNTAEFQQPFPDLLVILSNLAGDIVAQRRFVPDEYLGDLGEKLILMAPNKPVSLALEVLDPGNDAVNFEFALL